MFLFINNVGHIHNRRLLAQIVYNICNDIVQC